MKLFGKWVVLSCILTIAGPAFAEKSGAEQMREFEFNSRKANIANYTLPAQPLSGKALVYVVRPGTGGGLVRFNVFVDSKDAADEVGNTRGGEYIYFNVSPGLHRIFSKAENWAETQVSVNAGDIIFIKQEVNIGFLMAGNSLSMLGEVDGKFQVKHLKKGEILRSDYIGAKDAASSPEHAVSPPTAEKSDLPTKPVASVPDQKPTRDAASPAPQVVGTEVAQKLRELQSLWKDGLLTDEEYKAKKSQLIDRL